MRKVCTYLNFSGNTEEAFLFYKKVFKSEFSEGVMKYGDMPGEDGDPKLSDEDSKKIMHISLPILDGHLLMGSDMIESMSPVPIFGDNISVMLYLDSKSETEELFTKLSEGATKVAALEDTFWGAYFGSLTDRFGIPWLFNCEENS